MTIGYSAAHQRLGKLLGPARDRTCVDCDQPAQHWSYNGGAPREYIDDLQRYALDPDYYSPRCASCHRIYDLPVREKCDWGHPYDEANTYLHRGIRRCRACRTWYRRNISSAPRSGR